MAVSLGLPARPAGPLTLAAHPTQPNAFRIDELPLDLLCHDSLDVLVSERWLEPAAAVVACLHHGSAAGVAPALAGSGLARVAPTSNLSVIGEEGSLERSLSAGDDSAQAALPALPAIVDVESPAASSSCWNAAQPRTAAGASLAHGAASGGSWPAAGDGAEGPDCYPASSGGRDQQRQRNQHPLPCPQEQQQQALEICCGPDVRATADQGPAAVAAGTGAGATGGSAAASARDSLPDVPCPAVVLVSQAPVVESLVLLAGCLEGRLHALDASGLQLGDRVRRAGGGGRTRHTSWH